MLLTELAPRHIDGNAALARVLDQIVLAFAIRLALPATHSATFERFIFIGNDQTEVDADRAPETTALLASAYRRVEREQTRTRIRVVNIAMRAMQVRRE